MSSEERFIQSENIIKIDNFVFSESVEPILQTPKLCFYHRSVKMPLQKCFRYSNQNQVKMVLPNKREARNNVIIELNGLILLFSRQFYCLLTCFT